MSSPTTAVRHVPTVSFVLPLRNGGRWAPDLVAALQAQTLKPAEIVVLDSESDDGGAARFAAAGAKVVGVERRSFSHGGTRNRGAELTKGDVLVFGTQDAVPCDTSTLSRLVEPLCQGVAVASFGRHVPRPDATPLEVFARAVNFPETPRVVGLQDVNALGVHAYYFSNALSAIRRDVFDSIGGFAEHVVTNEDMLLAATLLETGHCIAYAADARVWHSHRLGPAATFRRYFDIGTFFVDAHQHLRVAADRRDGAAYVVRLLQYLMRERAFGWIAPAILESSAKAAGYALGARYRSLPTALLPRLSSLPQHWEARAR